MKRADEALSWDDVSLYRNPFDDVIARIAFDGTGMYGRQNSPTSPEFATSGSFDKCWTREGGRIALLKRGSTGFANAGYEPYSEAFASQLLDAAHVDHVPYEVVRFHGKLASRCPPVHFRGRWVRRGPSLLLRAVLARRYARVCGEPWRRRILP